VLSVIYVIPVILYHYLLPQEAADSKNFDIKKVEKLGLISSASITIILIILTPTIIANLFPEYKNALVSTQVVLLAAIPLSISALFNSSLLAKEKSFQVLVASAIFLVTQYVLIYTLGSIYGLIGISISTVNASIIQAAFLIIVSRKISTSAKTKISRL
jgi:O-antigen/teichoic acid export membrane protein